MLSLFANKVHRASTGTWDPNKFKIDAPPTSRANVGAGDLTINYPESVQSQMAVPVYGGGQGQAYGYNYGPMASVPVPQQNFMYDPRLYRAMDHIGPEISQFIQPSRQTRENGRNVIKPLETNNLAVNPVENIESSYGVKTGPSAPQQLREEWSNRYCDDAIPSKYLTERTIGTYELMGLNEAQRRSRPMGEGVPNIGPAVPFEQTNEFTFGKGPVSMSMVSHDLYHQNFATLGGPPAVYTGIYTDPLTGIQYDTYESGMPPPDGDWYDMSYSSAKNRKLDCLQGGWSNNTPIPPRKEILEGDWNQENNRTLNTFGGGGAYGDVTRCRRMDNLERSVRFTMNDFTPDNEAPELTGVPANVDGIYGNVKVRFNPRLTGTNRGHDEEDSYRTGPATQWYHNNKMMQEFTKSPQCMPALDYMGAVDGYGAHSVYAEQERSEYNPSNELRGLEVTSDLSEHGVGYVDTYGEQTRSEYNPTTRQAGVDVNPELGEHGAAYELGVSSRSDYNPPTKQWGTEVTSDLGEHGAAYELGVSTRSDYNPPTRQWGTQVTSELGMHGVTEGGTHAPQNRLEYNMPMKQMGQHVNAELSVHGVSDGGAQPLQSRAEYEAPHKVTGTTVEPELGEHGVGYVDTYGDQSRSEYEVPHKFTGTTVTSELGEHGVGFVDTYGEQSRSEYEAPHKFTGTTVTSELGEHGVGYVDTYGEQSRSEYEAPHKFTGTTVDPQQRQHGVHGGNTHAVQSRQALTRFNRIALLKFMQGAIKSDTDGAMNRAPNTRFNDRKSNINTVLIPSKMPTGLGGPQNVERVPTSWSYRRTPNGHRPDHEYVGNVRKAVENDVPIIGQFPVKFELDEWRMGPAFSNNGTPNDVVGDYIIRPVGPCMSY